MLFFSDQATYGSCAHIGFLVCFALGISEVPKEKPALGALA